MVEKLASFDDGQGFYRYLPISRRDRDWGLFVPGGGLEIGTPTSELPFYSYPAEYAYSWSAGRKFVDEYQLVYFNSGAPWRVETEATGAPFVAPPGSVLLLFPGVWHRYVPIFDDSGSHASTLWCSFGGNFARRLQRRELISPRHPVLHVGSNPSVEMSFKRLHNYLRPNDSFFLQQPLAAAFMELLASVDAASRMGVGPMLSAGIIQHAKTILEDLTVPHSTAREVSEMLKVPYNEFRHSFKLATGLSPYQYHLQAVTQRAKELLQGTSLSVKEIAMSLQFTDQFYFAKFFKRKTGSTPTDWRARSHQKTSPGP